MLSLPPKNPLVFTASPLDRAGDARAKPDWLAEKRQATTTRLLPFWKFQPLLRGPLDAPETQLGYLSPSEAERVLETPGQEIFLGEAEGIAYFARDISAIDEPLGLLPFTAHFRDARSCLEVLPVPETAILGQAKALLEWHARRRFCSNCGAMLQSLEGGYRRHCPSCDASHFPRTDPAVIMLVTKGTRCLLARNKRFGVALNHSALAGFVEPGESLEEAVRREVFEEVGIRVGDVRYVASQPWPFPSSLMIGCIAEAISEDIHVDGNEIVAAEWFGRDVVARLLAGEDINGIKLPRPSAIALHLIKTWVAD